MYKFNPKEFVKSMEGTPLGETFGQVISGILATTKSADPLRNWSLGTKIANATEVELSASDVSFIKELAKTSTYAPFAVGQIIELLEGLKKSE